jgi:serine/threonine protein kinase
MMRRISHENVLDVISFCTKHNPPYFTMDVASSSLEDELPVLSQSEDSALKVFGEIATGLQALHNQGVIHRDLKPANALRMPSGRIKLCDLGLARYEDRDTAVLTQTCMRLGTDAYAAPEQRMDGGCRNADVRTDVYQLGKTLYQLLTGREPILVDLSKLPSGLSHVIKKCTREDPNTRYQTVSEVVDAIELYRRAKDPLARPVDTFEELLSQIEDRVAKERVREDEILQVLTLLANLSTDDDLLLQELFDKLPLPVVAVAASSLADYLSPVLTRYARSVDKSVRGRSFAYAEIVAERMLAITTSASEVELIVLAIQTALIAAVDLNRYAAMDTVNKMLLNVKDTAVAMETASMLRHQLDRYSVIASQIQSSRLHPAIRDVRDKAISKSDS